MLNRKVKSAYCDEHQTTCRNPYGNLEAELQVFTRKIFLAIEYSSHNLAYVSTTHIYSFLFVCPGSWEIHQQKVISDWAVTIS